MKMETTLKETTISHLVKPEDLQHHGTLFAGQMAKWLVECLFIAACRFIGKPEDIVCIQVHGLKFTTPVNNGDILQIKARVAYAGTKSVTCYGEAGCEGDSTARVVGMATFVTLNKNGKPYAHGFCLPDKYIEQNRRIYELAQKTRELAKS
jgi:acyl-CoA hydrolase